MSKFNVIIGFSRLTEEAFESKSEVIIASKTSNASYPNPEPTIIVAAAAIDDYKTAKAKGAKGGAELTAIKNQKRLIAEDILQKIGRYVENTGNNNYAVLISSGYDIKGHAQPGTKPKAPESLTLIDGNLTGIIKAKCAVVDNATMYIFRHTTTPAVDASWKQELPVTKTTFLIENLVHGTDVSVQVMALNANGHSNWSNTSVWLVR